MEPHQLANKLFCALLKEVWFTYLAAQRNCCRSIVEFIARSFIDRVISAFNKAEKISGVNSKPAFSRSLSLSEFLSKLFNVMLTATM